MLFLNCNGVAIERSCFGAWATVYQYNQSTFDICTTTKEYYGTCLLLLGLVKPVFRGHSNERTPCDQGTFSQNGDLSSQYYKTCNEGTLPRGY